MWDANKQAHEHTVEDYLQLKPGESLLSPLISKTPYDPIDAHGLTDNNRGFVSAKPIERVCSQTDPAGINFYCYGGSGFYKRPRHHGRTDHGLAYDLRGTSRFGSPAVVVVGEVSGGQPRVAYDYQKRGIGSHLIAHFCPMYLGRLDHPSRTEAGYYNRMRAHAILVTWALIDNEPVPPDVLAQYCVHNNCLRLRQEVQPDPSKQGSLSPAQNITSIFGPKPATQVFPLPSIPKPALAPAVLLAAVSGPTPSTSSVSKPLPPWTTVLAQVLAKSKKPPSN